MKGFKRYFCHCVDTFR